MTKFKIGIVGAGVVGNALHHSFKKKTKYIDDIIVYDKYKNIGSFHELLLMDILFLCLPTLFDEKTKSYDTSSIHEVCQKLYDTKYEGLVVIKSTIEPTTTEKLSELYGLNFCHNPEFLTARTAQEDFENQKHIVIGKQCDNYYVQLLGDFYSKCYPSAEISICTSAESEFMKLSVNNFYAVKIQFFNELFLLSQKLDNVDYNIVRELMIKNGWIHPMHTIVPGNDGKLSFGGMCFPKDTSALLHFMKNMETPHALLEATVKERNIMRNQNLI